MILKMFRVLVLKMGLVFCGVDNDWLIMMLFIASFGVEGSEPATKKIRIDGESYIVAVTDEGNKAISIEHDKSGNEQQMFLVRVVWIRQK